MKWQTKMDNGMATVTECRGSSNCGIKWQVKNDMQAGSPKEKGVLGSAIASYGNPKIKLNILQSLL